MLNSLLAWIIALGSLGLYFSGFLLPEVRRKNDLIWSGVGLLYALVLWANGDRIKGGLLLGQMASVALIVWLGWQTLDQRRQLAAPGTQTPIPDSVQGILPFVKQGWERLLAQEPIEPSAASISTAKTDSKTLKIGSFEIPLDFSKLLAGLSGTAASSTTASSSSTTAPPSSTRTAASSAAYDEWEEDETPEPKPPVAESAPESTPSTETSQSEVLRSETPQPEAIEPEPEVVHDSTPSPEAESPSVDETPVDASTPEISEAAPDSVTEPLTSAEDVQSSEASGTSGTEPEPEATASIPVEVIAEHTPTAETEIASPSEDPPSHSTEGEASDTETVEDSSENAAVTATHEQTQTNSNDDGWPPPDPIT